MWSKNKYKTNQTDAILFADHSEWGLTIAHLPKPLKHSLTRLI